MNRVRVLFFATLRDKAGTKTVEVELDAGATVRDLKNVTVARFPGLKEAIEHCLASVNHEYSADETEIPPAAEVAFFPPVSGGSCQCSVFSNTLHPTGTARARCQ